MNVNKKIKLLEDPVIRERADLIYKLLQTVPGMDVDSEGLKETPLRVAAMMNEMFAGYAQDGTQILHDAMFTDVHSQDMVIVRDIPFYSVCEHHIKDFFGTVNIAYVPQNGVIVGLSKLARLVDVYARRAQVQERLGQQIMKTLIEVMNPTGVAVIIKARHMCMESRGVQKNGAQTVTAHLDGLFKLDEKARQELYDALKL